MTYSGFLLVKNTLGMTKFVNRNEGFSGSGAPHVRAPSMRVETLSQCRAADRRVCVRARHACVYMCVRVNAYVCVCECVRALAYVCVCVPVCICVRVLVVRVRAGASRMLGLS